MKHDKTERLKQFIRRNLGEDHLSADKLSVLLGGSTDIKSYLKGGQEDENLKQAMVNVGNKIYGEHYSISGKGSKIDDLEAIIQYTILKDKSENLMYFVFYCFGPGPWNEETFASILGLEIEALKPFNYYNMPGLSPDDVINSLYTYLKNDSGDVNLKKAITSAEEKAGVEIVSDLSSYKEMINDIKKKVEIKRLEGTITGAFKDRFVGDSLKGLKLDDQIKFLKCVNAYKKHFSGKGARLEQYLNALKSGQKIEGDYDKMRLSKLLKLADLDEVKYDKVKAHHQQIKDHFKRAADSQMGKGSIAALEKIKNLGRAYDEKLGSTAKELEQAGRKITSVAKKMFSETVKRCFKTKTKEMPNKSEIEMEDRSQKK